MGALYTMDIVNMYTSTQNLSHTTSELQRGASERISVDFPFDHTLLEQLRNGTAESRDRRLYVWSGYECYVKSGLPIQARFDTTVCASDEQEECTRAHATDNALSTLRY